MKTFKIPYIVGKDPDKPKGWAGAIVLNNHSEYEQVAEVFIYGVDGEDINKYNIKIVPWGMEIIDSKKLAVGRQQVEIRTTETTLVTPFMFSDKGMTELKVHEVTPK